MKKIVLCTLIVIAALLCFCACEKEDIDNSTESIEHSPAENASANAAADEDEFLKLFEECYAIYEKNGITADLPYARLEDIYQANTDNEMMKNLYYFCNACGYYRIADILGDTSYKTAGNKEAAKIDPNYDGPYAEEVISFAKELLGSDYAALADTATVEQENYEKLTMQDKKDILNYITEHGDADVDALWEELANYYGISTEHISLINTDIDVISAVGHDRKVSNEQTSANIEYNAFLEYGSDSVVIADSKEALSEFLTNVANDNESAITDMVSNGLIAYVEKGTKINIIEKKLSTAKIKILEGLYEGVDCWTIIEAVHEK